MKRASIGVSAHLGWAATAVISVGKNGLRVLRTDRIETADPDDFASLEPYHLAGGFKGLERVPPPPNPKAVVQRGLRKQRRFTAKALGRIEKLLERQGDRIAFGGILVGRGRSADTLEKATKSHIQIHIEEGNAVRESIRLALSQAGSRVYEIDQKTVQAIASDELSRRQSELLRDLDAATPENGGPWRKEEKMAALAAWIAWGRGAGRVR